jgi:serine/threonine protein kinase
MDASYRKLRGKLVERSTLFDRLRQSDTQPLSLGQYHLIDELGRGGMGRVYKALHTIMDREVALKVISPELIRDPVAIAWFLREVRASTQLNHPNIVMAYDANEADGLYFLVMEYVHGMTLDARVKQQGPLPIPYACALIRQAALGLQHAHEKGMVHRDIKPSNLLIPAPRADPPSEVLVKILDFGLARLQGKSKGDTIALRGEAGVLGTPDYIAPEQSRDIHAADIRSDLYSLGCVFYFTLAGSVPFPADNAMEKLIRHLMEEPEPLEKVRPDVPAELTAIVRRLMAKDPADRYQTPAELARELEKVSGTSSEKPPDAFLPPSEPPAPDPQSQHTRVLEKVPVFVPSQAQAELTGASLLEPLWKYASEVSRCPGTHDTLTTSHPGETEQARAEALRDGAGSLAPSVSPHPVSDSTFQEIGIPDKTGGLGGEAPSSETLPPIDPEVFRLWRRWVALLETIVAGRDPSRVNSESYQTAHALLLQACRAAITACPVPERRAFYEECLSIAKPWLKLQSFIRGDSTMLDSLLRRCREIEIELNNGRTLWTFRQGLALALLALCPAGAALWYGYYGRLWLPSLFRAFDGDFSISSLHSAWTFLQTHPALLMGVLFPLVIIFSVVLLSRTPRT